MRRRFGSCGIIRMRATRQALLEAARSQKSWLTDRSLTCLQSGTWPYRCISRLLAVPLLLLSPTVLHRQQRSGNMSMCIDVLGAFQQVTTVLSSGHKPGTFRACAGLCMALTLIHIATVTSPDNIQCVLAHLVVVSRQVDQKKEAVLVPIYGVMVPFHILTVKNATNNQDGDHAYIRLNFNFGPGFEPGSRFPQAVFLKELSFRTSDTRHAARVVQEIKVLRSSVGQREKEQAERATLVQQERLIKSKVCACLYLLTMLVYLETCSKPCSTCIAGIAGGLIGIHRTACAHLC